MNIFVKSIIFITGYGAELSFINQFPFVAGNSRRGRLYMAGVRRGSPEQYCFEFGNAANLEYFRSPIRRKWEAHGASVEGSNMTKISENPKIPMINVAILARSLFVISYRRAPVRCKAVSGENDLTDIPSAV